MPRLSADERREQLVEAAIRVMIRDGVAKTTTRAVVMEAEVPLGAFHYCFRSKVELLQSVIEQIMKRTLTPVIDRPEGASPYDVIRATLHAYWDRVRERPAEHLVTYELTQYALRQPGLADLARKQYRHYLAINTSYLESLARTVGITWTVDLPVLARHSLSLLDGLTLNWLIDPDDAQAAAALDEYAAYLASVARPTR
ncbi:TetR family transcriptional regulator C-terminal domain-containing protein [Streptomyces sp. NPDC048629]|uniref:TetR/AcrR family transcriptional regulator n=1 Tax=Streptomyces sp. NPDC048629 TaxID=3154824 RepID=UPI003442166C